LIKPTLETHQIEHIEDLSGLVSLFLKKHSKPNVFRVVGEMGAGKTTFIHAICDALGVTFLGSPTFSLVHEYETNKGFDIIHFDLYRLKSIEEAYEFGFEEYLDRNAYVFIEWADMVEPLLPQNISTIVIVDDGKYRHISF
jgi:tRNA threonylcarbamoyladenosine biosynthesis protein TsaE